MADAAECSERAIKNIRRNLRLFGNVHAPPNYIGRRRTITPLMLEGLVKRCDTAKQGCLSDNLIRTSLVSGTGRETMRVCQKGNRYPNF